MGLTKAGLHSGVVVISSGRYSEIFSVLFFSAIGTCRIRNVVAPLDARPTGDQEVAGSTPAGRATIFRGD